ISITAVYKPPSIPKNNFVENIQNNLETNALGGDNNFELLVGDMNMDLFNIDDSSYNYLTAMSQLGFQSYINSITRFDSKTCLDHIFVNTKSKSNNLDLETYVLDIHITDHGPTMINIVSNKKISCKKNQIS
ncbi:hypothetical protein HHI36_017985, partial [Cryptolaemus montrouzieri]